MQAILTNNKVINLFAIGVLITLWLLVNRTSLPIPDVKNISIIEAATLIEQEGTVILDVREQKAFDKRHLPNAILVPVGDLNERLAEIHSLNATEIIVYCNRGSTRGPNATKQLNDAGFNNARNLKGGIEGWEKANLKLITQ